MNVLENSDESYCNRTFIHQKYLEILNLTSTSTCFKDSLINFALAV
jgi:hypothetical protein